MKNRNTRRGFTLIELLVVVLIIGILAAVALPQYQKAVLKTRLTEAISFGNAAQKAVQLWVLQNGFPANTDSEINLLAPDAATTLDIDIPTASNSFRYSIDTVPGTSIEWAAFPKWFAYSSPNGIVWSLNSDGSIDRVCWGVETEGYKMCQALDALQPNTWTIEY